MGGPAVTTGKGLFPSVCGVFLPCSTPTSFSFCMNKKRETLLSEYKLKKEADHQMQTCKVCGERSPKNNMEPHHPSGRRGNEILNYFWVHPTCHRWIHDNPKDAENRGLLDKGRNL